MKTAKEAYEATKIFMRSIAQISRIEGHIQEAIESGKTNVKIYCHEDDISNEAANVLMNLGYKVQIKASYNPNPENGLSGVNIFIDWDQRG